MNKELQDTVQAVKSYMAAERESGVKEYLLSTHLLTPNPQSPIPNPGLASLRSEVLRCQNCQLAKTRTNVVFGEGSSNADLVFIGEAPGRDEDMQGRPFVGRAGKLLTKIIEAMKLKREDVFICNILKCRPPGNRDPLPVEVASCRDYLSRQLEIINPKVICCLGRHAFFTLMGDNAKGSISTLRGKFFDFNGIKLIPTFHPAYLLRNPGAIKLAETDYRKILKEIKKM